MSTSVPMDPENLKQANDEVERAELKAAQDLEWQAAEKNMSELGSYEDDPLVVLGEGEKLTGLTRRMLGWGVESRGEFTGIHAIDGMLNEVKVSFLYRGSRGQTRSFIRYSSSGYPPISTSYRKMSYRCKLLTSTLNSGSRQVLRGYRRSSRLRSRASRHLPRRPILQRSMLYTSSLFVRSSYSLVQLLLTFIYIAQHGDRSLVYDKCARRDTVSDIMAYSYLACSTS